MTEMLILLKTELLIINVVIKVFIYTRKIYYIDEGFFLLQESFKNDVHLKIELKDCHIKSDFNELCIICIMSK